MVFSFMNCKNKGMTRILNIPNHSNYSNSS